MTILMLFFVSGVTALVYEVIWSKYLSLLFGSTIQAQTVVLAVFMGGLAIGNKLFGKWADRARQPLTIYDYLELAVGAWAFLARDSLQHACRQSSRALCVKELKRRLSSGFLGAISSVLPSEI